MTSNLTKSNLPKIKERPQDSNKMTFGLVAGLIGCKDMTGAAILCGTAALRSGAGLMLISSESDALPIIKTALPEAICVTPDEIFCRKANAFVVGCGIGRAYDGMLTDFLPQLTVPTVIDADGINYLASHIDVLSKMQCDVVLTPHPMEMSRLTGIGLNDIQNNRVEVASSFAIKHGCTLVLKGHNTVIADRDGNTFINTTGGSELAKGGSGDVLAGVIASLCAQGYTPLSAAKLGVYIHGMAGSECANEYGVHGVLPSDLCKAIGRILG